MKEENSNKEIDINEVAITIEVDSDVINKVRTGEITHVVLQINEDNQTFILENFDGNLVLVTEELPDTFYGCYFYNDGEFPYAIKRNLNFIVLEGGEEDCLVRIIDVDTEPGTRINYQGAGKPVVEDPEGDSCIWDVQFEVVPFPEEPRTYLMRWNPSISSFTEQNYKDCFEKAEDGKFFLEWSIFEWEEARRGDMFFMLRVGDDKAGIAFNGYFLSDPYTGDDWKGSTKRRCYVDMVCQNAVEPEEVPFIPLSKLKEAIPEYNWEKGHSGELLPADVREKLDELWSNE